MPPQAPAGAAPPQADPFAAYRPAVTPPAAAAPPGGDPFAAYRAKPLAAAPPPASRAPLQLGRPLTGSPGPLQPVPWLRDPSIQRMGGGAVGGIIGAAAGGPVGAAVGAGIGGGGMSALQGGDAGDIAGSALTQAGLEAGGQIVGRVISWPLRAALSSRVGKAATSSISGALENAATAWETFRGRGAALSPADIGTATHTVAQGPGRRSLNQIGQAVEDAAQTGPDVDLRPVKAQLEQMGGRLQTSGERNASIMAESEAGGHSPEDTVALLQAAKDQGLALEHDHPLPGVLGRLQNQPDVVPFADAHILKRSLDEAVNWNSPAKAQVKQITKGIRGSLRDTMAGHEPYDQATAAYQATLPLFNQGYVRALARHATDSPESLIKGIKGDSPTKLQMLFDVLDTHATAGGGGASGAQAKQGIQAAWTYQNLIRPGIGKFPENVAKMDLDFRGLMYGDPAGRQVLNNLTQISDAYQKALADEAAFRASTLAKAPPGAAQTVSDVAHVVLQPHSVFSLRSLGRLATGEGRAAKMSDLVEWASRSDTTTKALVDALASHTPGLALANLGRAAGIALFPDEPQMMVNHPQQPAATPPPSVARAATPPPR